MPVVRTEGRSLDVRLRDYQIFLATGLRPRAAQSAARGAPLLQTAALNYLVPWTIH